MKVCGIVLLSLLAFAAGKLVINELDVSSSGGQYSEFVELYNGGRSTVNVLNYRLEIWFDDGSGSYYIDDSATHLLLDFNVTAGGYYVMCVVPGLIPGCVQELHDYLQAWLPDNDAYLALYDPEDNLVDLVGYAQASPVADSTCETAPALSDESSEASQTIARYPNGQDTDNNSADFKAGCASPGAANVLFADVEVCFTPTLSDVVINEIDYTQPGGDTKEFIELHNRANYEQGSNIASYVLNIINDANATVLTVPLSATGYAPNIPVHGYWILCVAGSADYCTGPGARPVGGAAYQLPSAVDWLPNPGSGSSSYSVQLIGSGGILDVLTYGGTQPGVTLGTGIADLDSRVESRYGVSRYPDSWDTADNSQNFRASCITPNDINTILRVNCDPSNSPSPSPSNSASPSATASATATPSPSSTPSASPIRNAISSPLALCEKEKIDDAEEEARLLAQRKKFCRQYVPESETKRDNEREAMEAAYDEAAQCWYDKAAECPLDRRSEARLMAKELKVTLQFHNKEIEAIPKPKRGLARADKDDEVEEVEGGRAKRWDILWDPLTEPYPEDLEYSLEYCEKKREYIRFYHKALRYKIIACNETRAYYDCQRDAFTRFKETYLASYADCNDFSCEP